METFVTIHFNQAIEVEEFIKKMEDNHYKVLGVAGITEVKDEQVELNGHKAARDVSCIEHAKQLLDMCI